MNQIPNACPVLPSVHHTSSDYYMLVHCAQLGRPQQRRSGSRCRASSTQGSSADSTGVQPVCTLMAWISVHAAGESSASAAQGCSAQFTCHDGCSKQECVALMSFLARLQRCCIQQLYQHDRAKALIQHAPFRPAGLWAKGTHPYALESGGAPAWSGVLLPD